MDRRHFLRSTALATVAAPAAIGSVMTSTGCATLLDLLENNIRLPEVKIAGMKIQDANLSRISALFDIDIINPNPIALSLQQLDYGLLVDGGRVAAGSSKKGVTLKARGKSTNPLEVNFDVAKTAQAIIDLLMKGRVDYALDTMFHVGTRNFPLKVPAGMKGKFDLPKLPNFAVKSFQATRIDLNGIDFRAVTSLGNLNPFDLPLDKLKFNINLNGRDVLKNKVTPAVRIAGKKTEDVALDFTVGLLDLGLSAASLVQRPELNWRINTEIASGKLALPFKAGGKLRLA